jgi:tritrans,polycis-undecaprenyl-diphosphate synthase [geranylgeranyl-diphosphate specific]
MTNSIKHIGVIVDGNRRYAKKENINPFKGHEKGAEKIKDFLEWCDEFGIKEITAYVLSVQNLNRKKEEVEHLFSLFKEFSKKVLEPKNLEELKKRKAKIKFIGRKEILPKELQEKIKEIEEKTKENGEKTINFAMAYGGREEITDAMKKIAEKIKKNEIKTEEINEKTIEKELYLNSEPEIIIRTGGVQRTSNFLIWQSNYSEWFFLEKMWPEIEKEDLKKILEKYPEIERRFGK